MTGRADPAPRAAPTAFVLFLLAFAWQPRLVAAADYAAPITPDRTTALFNGTNLSNWTSWLIDSRHADPRNVFTVTNGLLRISGDGLGYLRTHERYRDYHLIAEFRWGQANTAWGDRLGRARDSGIFLHATGPDGNSHDGDGAFMAAIECNLFQGATGDILLIRGSDTLGQLIAPRIETHTAPVRDRDNWPWWQPGGIPATLERWGRLNHLGKSSDWRDLWDMRGPDDPETPAGSWNRIDCVARADDLEIRVNGAVVNRATRIHPSHGHILLQCEGSEIFFRTLDLHPLR